ncbi:F-box only protein 48 [Gracilinanus agilis]|uniref:F-box only protein 48 n=1 Tax=Gracilinanus agilis TaxID=191870 RepID=UPI001CFCAEF9|nr:F-box only protein 48 [Gracilinanus agilis]
MQKISKRNSNSPNAGKDPNPVCPDKKKENKDNFVEILPPEVTFKIFSQLDIQSLCRAATICKSWNQAIKNCDYLWKHHCLTVRAICQKEIDGDRGNGYSWRRYMSERDR